MLVEVPIVGLLIVILGVPERLPLLHRYVAARLGRYQIRLRVFVEVIDLNPRCLHRTQRLDTGPSALGQILLRGTSLRWLGLITGGARVIWPFGWEECGNDALPHRLRAVGRNLLL